MIPPFVFATWKWVLFRTVHAKDFFLWVVKISEQFSAAGQPEPVREGKPRSTPVPVLSDTEQQEARNIGAVGGTDVASKEPGLVPFLAQLINERGIEKAFRFGFAGSGISLSFDIQYKLNRFPVRRQVLA
jgi:hypothetical protein